MKATLIYTGISKCGFNSLGKGSEGSFIHHGLASISAYAKKKGFGINLIDLRRLKRWSDFKKEIKTSGSNIYALTMNSVDYHYVNRCIDIIKSIDISAKIVVGGIHPTVMLKEVLFNEKIDYIITGEGEISFSDLLLNIQRGDNSPKLIRGVPPHLDEIPFIDRELFGQAESPIFPSFLKPFVTVIVGRGCKYNCSFCQPAERLLFGNKVRRRSVDNIIEELKILQDRYAFKSLMFHDDCLTEDKHWIDEFCEKYNNLGFTQPFTCQSRVDFICQNEHLISKMKDVGLKGLIIGFESGSQRILDFLKKGTKVEENFEAARICKKYNIEIWANYMLGIPTETKEEVMATVNMIREIAPNYYSPAYFTPHPGSALFEYCLENKLSLIRNHSQYRRNPDGKKIRGIDYRFIKKAIKK